ncbi:hypothetical protein E5D57_001654 [Metarhizium anisopliae]|nr:hypothetical protein E5D57_001654 [Metarhizium anisopliae]
MRWLGVWLDRRLTFNTHIEKWSLKAEKVISQLRFVNNTVRGTSAVAARRAIYAVALPTLFYGLDTWFPGFLSESTHKGARMITKTHLSKLQVILNKACHAVLPVWKTTPQVILWKEAGIPPADIILKQQQARTALRYATLDAAHPVSRRLRQAQHEVDQSNHPTTCSQTLQRHSRLLRTAAWAKEVERPRLTARRFNDNIPTEAEGNSSAGLKTNPQAMSSSAMAPRQKRIPQGMDSRYSTTDASLIGALDNLAAEKSLTQKSTAL